MDAFSTPHVLIFPFPAQGHVNSMLKLAELLCLAGLHVTFLVSLTNFNSLVQYANADSRFKKYPGFRFKTLPKELYDGKIHTTEGIMMLYETLQLVSKSFLPELLAVRDPPVGTNDDSSQFPKITCLIADGVLSNAMNIAQGFGLPVFYFRTISACAFWCYYCIQELVESGEIPFKGNDLDAPIVSIKGMEGFLRRRDLPSLCQVNDVEEDCMNMLSVETRRTARAHGLILNTFEDLEGSIMSHIRAECPNLYPIGPLSLHLKTRLEANSISSPTSSNSLWEEDRSCIKWLDQQPSKSVIYVSFGSIATVTRDQLLEFWHGLVNSGKKFLWVIRPDSVGGGDGENQVPADLEEGTKARGYMVSWAPQEEVLAHPAVGGFLTHSGWNSTLESIVEGVPMICWPYFADQQINSRFVGEVWKLGLDMKDTCDRVMVEKMVRDLMEVRNAEFQEKADLMAKLARMSVLAS